MSIHKLKRVMRRLRYRYKTPTITKLELEVVIMRECGTDPRTVKSNISAMVKLGYLEKVKKKYKVTKKDLTG